MNEAALFALLELAMVGVIVAVSALVVAAKLFPTTATRLRWRAASRLGRPGRPGWQQWLSRRFTPPTASRGTCGSGCSSCAGCASQGPAGEPQASTVKLAVARESTVTWNR